MLLAAACLPGLLAAPVAAQQGWEAVVHQVDAKPRTGPDEIKGASARAGKAAASPSAVTPADTQPERKPAKDAAAASPAQDGVRKGVEGPAFETAAARQYCVNIADAAAEAKFAWQKKVLTDIGQDIDKRIALLEAKTAEYKIWLARRDEFAKRAQDNLVLIYSRMKADAAALQLAAMDEETAAAVIIKLDPRTASAILNEMEPAQAARLTTTISGVGKIAPSPAAAATPEGKKS
jgi:flagellar motility protein MotE (MotC chaperone)